MPIRHLFVSISKDGGERWIRTRGISRRIANRAVTPVSVAAVVLPQTPAPPRSRWPLSSAGESGPFAPPARYWGPVRPCAPHWFSAPRGSSAWRSPLASRRQVTTFRTRASRWSHAVFMPVAARPVGRLPPNSRLQTPEKTGRQPNGRFAKGQQRKSARAFAGTSPPRGTRSRGAAVGEFPWPSRHPPGLQTKALRRVGRVERPRGLIAAWVCACCAQRRRPAVALTKPEKRTAAQDLTAPPTGAHRRATTACVFSVPAHRARLAASAVTRPRPRSYHRQVQ